MKRIYPLLLFSLCLIQSVAAQVANERTAFQNNSDSFVFEHFLDDSGFPLLGVTNILQDKKGFIWVGTFYGLYRFDGYQFVSYRNDLFDKNSITNNNITSICETRSGQLWVGTSNGLNRYDRTTDRFENYKSGANDENSIPANNIVALFEDRSETLWIGTENGGLSKFNRDRNNFTRFQNLTGKDNSVFGIGEDKNGGFWITNKTDLYKFNRLNGSVKNYPINAENRNDSQKSIIRSMYCDRDGIIWLGTIGGGLNRFDPTSEEFKNYRADANDPNSLNDNVVLTSYQTRSGKFMVGTVGGLNLYSKENDNFEVYTHDPLVRKSLTKGEVWAVFEDTNDQLWVGGTGGLDKFNQRSNRFSRFKSDASKQNPIRGDQILSIFEDKNDVLWIGSINDSKSRLSRYDLKNDRFEVIEQLGDMRVNSIFEDRSTMLWLGTNSGLVEFDRESGMSKTYKHDPNNPNSLGGNFIANIKSDRNGDLLIATTDNGVSKFYQDSSKFTRFRHDSNDPGSLSGNRVFSMLEDSRGQLWIGAENGLNKYVSETGKFIKYQNDPGNLKSISSDEILSIYEDKSGIIWIGTTTGGLNRFDRETETFTNFTERDGLPSNDVFQILEDELGNLWLFTDRGLARFNKETSRIRSFNTDDGVPYNPFDNKTAFKNSSGDFYFGGQDGFVKFDPRDFNESDFKPPIYLTNIRIFEQPLKTDKNITDLKQLDLSWKDYVVSFDFAALDFANPKKLQYQWKLEGFDSEWINGGTRRTATYTNLPGGDYVLKVKATNVDGVWTEESVIIKITVTPPFYRTYWFFGLIALTLGILAWFLYRNHTNRLKAINKVQMKYTHQLIESQEAERKRLASELHDGLGQDLIIIKNRVFLAQKNSEDQARLKKELDDISETTSHTLQQVRDITDGLRPMLLDKMGLTKALEAMLEKVTGVIEIEGNIDPIDEIFSETDEINIYRIVQESINNVIKHSNAANAFVEIERGEKEVLIKIKDNGDGFDLEKAGPKSGLGLVGLKERSRSLNGTFSINSRKGKGTEVSVKVPLPSNQYSER